MTDQEEFTSKIESMTDAEYHKFVERAYGQHELGRLNEQGRQLHMKDCERAYDNNPDMANMLRRALSICTDAERTAVAAEDQASAAGTANRIAASTNVRSARAETRSERAESRAKCALVLTAVATLAAIVSAIVAIVAASQKQGG